MRTFKVRASAAGKLMTNPRLKTETLSETTKTYLKEWLTEQLYGFKKEIYSKYIAKGITVENEGIDYAIQTLGLPFVLKNEQYFEDDYFCGTPDLILEDEVIDIKSSWDCFTFPLFEDEIPTKDYEYQLQVYMHLTGKQKARLVYVLCNSPEELTYETPKDYSNLPDKLRIKTFEVNYQPEVIETLKMRVNESRNFLNSLYNG